MSDKVRDLRVAFSADGHADVSWSEPVQDIEHLQQALAMRLLVARGDLQALGHPNYGSKLHELIGELLDRSNLELLRRYTRQALIEDPRVEAVTQLAVVPHPRQPGVVQISASVQAVSGKVVALNVTVDLG